VLIEESAGVSYYHPDIRETLETMADEKKDYAT